MQWALVPPPSIPLISPISIEQGELGNWKDVVAITKWPFGFENEPLYSLSSVVKHLFCRASGKGGAQGQVEKGKYFC